MNETEHELFDQADRICQDPAFRAILWRHLVGLPASARPEQLKTRIHPRDQMLQHSLRHHGDAHVALSQYYNVALQQFNAMRQILDAFFPDRGQAVDLLDFACGYGRLIRFLCMEVPPARIWASEIQPDAVDFVTGEFGVQGILSDFEPARFDPGRRFDFIWVASLFSHLPEPLFHAWLSRLTALLKPEGVLCFSVHDASLLPAGSTLPDTGLLYGQGSENAELDPACYGTTYVSQAFVAEAIRRTGEGWQQFRIPKGLAHEQDVHVVSRGDLSVLDRFRRGPWGWVDDRRLQGNELYLRGWAASLDDGPLEQVTILVNDETHHCPTGKVREDVRAVFDDPRLALAGWEFRQRLPSGTPEARVLVTATTTAGEKALLYAGTLHDAAPGTRQDRHSDRRIGLGRWLARLLR